MGTWGKPQTLEYVAKWLGHKDIRVTYKHYAHLAPSYVADTIRANLPPLGSFEPGNVVKIDRRQK